MTSRAHLRTPSGSVRVRQRLSCAICEARRSDSGPAHAPLTNSPQSREATSRSSSKRPSRNRANGVGSSPPTGAIAATIRARATSSPTHASITSVGIACNSQPRISSSILQDSPLRRSTSSFQTEAGNASALRISSSDSGSCCSPTSFPSPTRSSTSFASSSPRPEAP
jgi:hypothetical protein